MKQAKRLLALLLVMAMVMVNVPAPVFAVGTTNEDGYIEVYTIEDLYSIRNDLTAKYILMNDINLTAATAKGGDWDFMGNGWNPIGSDDIYGSLAFSGEFNGNGKRIIGMRIDGTTMPSGTGTKYVGLFANVTGSVHDLHFENTTINWPQGGYSYIGTLAGMNSGSIYNISADVTITLDRGTDNVVGGIVGKSQGTVSRCSTAGSIKYSYSYSSGSAHTSGVGGIVGYANGGTISECYNTATLMQKNTSNGSEGFVGGICGYAFAEWNGSSSVAIRDCYNTGNVISSYNYSVAGILGKAAGGSTRSDLTVTNCYNIGKCLTTSGSANSGAYGIAYIYTDSKATVSNCYYLQGTGKSNTGATSLTAGQLKLQSSYSSLDFDSVWVMDTNAVYPYPQLRNNPQDLRVVENVIIASEPIKTEYKFGEAIDLTGASLQVEYTNGTSELIDITEDMLSGFAPTVPGVQNIIVTYSGVINSFNVTVNEKVYIPIYTIEDLYNIRNDMDANYILMNDIDMTEATAKGGDWDFMGNGWNPIGSEDIYSNTAFAGEFDGNGHKIIGMRINLTTKPSGIGKYVYVGLFARISGKVYDLSFEGGSISSTITVASDNLYVYTGALAGNLSGGAIENIHCNMDSVTTTGARTVGAVGGVIGIADGSKITNCSNFANIMASGVDAGGVVGYITQTGTIELSYNAGTITSTSSDEVGGIVGYASAKSTNLIIIKNCYNSGALICSYRPGGIVGFSAGARITSCYNCGTISDPDGYSIAANSGGTVANAYYLQGNGQNTTGSTALTDSQMKIQSMFAGFDFENVWVLNEYANHPYPQLRNNIQDLSESASLVSIIAIPNKTEYMTGDELDFTGAMVKVVYVSGKEEIIEITDDIVSGFNMNTVGEQKVKVTVAGASDTYTINVIQRPVVSEVLIVSEPNVKSFAVGTTFDFTGAKAKISYVGGVTEYKDITVEATTGGNINHVGKQTITYSFGGKSATFTVEVVGVALEKIVLTALPNKLAYLEGQALDLTGLVVTAVMNNGFESVIGTGYTISGYSSKPGNYTITVSYLEKNATFNVSVAERTLVSLALNTLPDKLEYVSGQAFNETGMQVIATYNNGDVIVAEDYTVSGFDNTPGIKNIVISLEGQSVSFTVKVIARVVTDFRLVSYPSKLDYIEYDAFDPAGLKAEATYNDGITEVVTDYELTGFSSKPGTHTITVAYEGFVQSFDINVTPRVLEDVKVIAPNKVTYYIGETFDATGMEVIACYNNGQEIAVDDYKISGFDSTAPGAKTITVTYGGIERSFAIAVQERSVVEANGSFIVDDLVGRLGEDVRLPVTVTCNTGIAGFRHEISFEAGNLKFVGVEMKGDYAKGTLIVNEEDAANGNVTILWFSNEDVQAKGLVYELVFTIQETAADGVTEVKLDFEKNDHGNISGEDVLFGKQDGSVEVRSYWLGDLNGDRKYAMVDLVMLAQYVADFDMTLTAKQLLSADVNEDGTIDIHDVILLNQWLLAEDF